MDIVYTTFMIIEYFCCEMSIMSGTKKEHLTDLSSLAKVLCTATCIHGQRICLRPLRGMHKDWNVFILLATDILVFTHSAQCF